MSVDAQIVASQILYLRQVCFGAYDQAANSIWSFRIPIIAQAFISLLQEGKAAAILAKYHANSGDERDPLVVFELAQIRHAIRMEDEINANTSYKSLFSTPGNRKRMRLIIAIALFSQWSGNGLVSYYINLVLDGVGIHDTKTKAYINGGLQVDPYVVLAHQLAK
ncbi:hypothetical protein H0H87_005408 [Tephrocybe sp. NHM501043]|nr:hypothetical protein H0H87_005408 [Tephrocybe sp. NHM501043]